MRPRLLLPAATGVFLCLTALPSPAPAVDRYVNPDGLCGGSAPCYPDLQSAINASGPGDPIHVQPAVYALAARVDVTRSVRILGPQADANPLPSQGTARVPGSAGEAIVDGGFALPTLVRILADGVEINGLEFRNGTGDLIESVVATPTAGTAIRNNIIHDSTGDEGLQLRNVTGAIVECNHVYGTAGDGLNLCCGSANGAIRFNEVHDVASQDAAIYVYGAASTTIEGNLVYGTTNNDGIKLGAKGGGDAAGTGGTILNNRTHDTAQDGIACYMSNTTVRCNEVYGSTTENGGIYLAWGIGNVAVIDNYVHDNAFNPGKWGDPAGIMIGTEVDAPSITVAGNRLERNSPNGITNKAAGLLAAESNWWGAADGPGPVGPGSGDRVSANVDYDAWLAVAPTPSCPTVRRCGDQPTPARHETWGRVKALYR